MPARKRRSPLTKGNPKLMVLMNSMRDQYKFAVHDQHGTHLCDVHAASKRYAVVAAKANGFETASKAYELNTQMEQK